MDMVVVNNLLEQQALPFTCMLDKQLKLKSPPPLYKKMNKKKFH